MSVRTRVPVVIGCASFALLSLFALFGPSRAAQPTPQARAEAPVDALANDHVPAPHAAVLQASAPPEAMRPSDEPLVFAGPGPNDPAGPGMLPHPITAEHARAYRDVELLDGAWRALKGRDFERARALLHAHATEYPSASDDMQEGLSILADCMQHPRTANRERAARFYAEHTASSMRRRIRTLCLQAR